MENFIKLLEKKHITVGDLIKNLEKFPKDAPIVYADADEEAIYRLVENTPSVLNMDNLDTSTVKMLRKIEKTLFVLIN